MPYWQLFYHIVWATKNRETILTPDIEPMIHNFIRTKAIGLGATIFAINGWEDHVHITASVRPSIALSQFIGQIKAVATAEFNHSGHPKAPIYWQDEYSVFSFDYRRLPYYIRYVEQQKEHHRNSTIILPLERTSGDGIGMIKEYTEGYLPDIESWFAEFEGEE